MFTFLIKIMPQKQNSKIHQKCTMFNCVRLFATPWTVARQAPLSMGILQASILEWVAMSSSRESSQPRIRTQFSCIAFFTIWATREAQKYWSWYPVPSPGDLPDPGIELGSPTLRADSLPAELPGKPTPHHWGSKSPCLVMVALRRSACTWTVAAQTWLPLHTL